MYLSYIIIFLYLILKFIYYYVFTLKNFKNLKKYTGWIWWKSVRTWKSLKIIW